MSNPSSPLTQDAKQTEQPVYSDIEQKYLGRLVSRLFEAKVNRDRKHPELEGRTFIQYYEDNEKIANSWTEKKEYDDGIVVNSGTIEQKLFTVAAEINRLNLSPEVRAFDKEDNELASLGVALTDAIWKTEKIEMDKEQKLLRIVELLKQGTCFVQDGWHRQFKKEKILNKQFDGKIKGVDWTEKIVKAFDGPRRRVLYAPGVYLGDVHCLNPDDQPFVFTVKITNRAEAESRYGQKDDEDKYMWERWENVPKTRSTLLSEETIGTLKVNDGFALLDQTNSEQVEEIHYMDRFNDEYQIFLNGIAMLPIGFPLSAIFPGGRLPITYQALQPINPFFALGRSFSAKTRRPSDLLDEILRLLILKTRKSIHPPYANISGKVISRASLMPGRITMGIDPNGLVKMGEEGQGVTAAEFQMFSKLQDNLDKNTVSPQVQGQQGKSGTTAFEVNVLTKQAAKVISLLVFSNSLLEQKVAYLRLDLILGKWIDPVDTKFDEVRGKIVNTYRNFSRDTVIEGRGGGLRQIVMTDEAPLPSPEEVMDQEDFQGTPEPTAGRRRTREELGMKPIEKVYLNPQEVRVARLMFFIEIDSHEEDTSATARLMFTDELKSIQALMSLGSQPNVQALEEEYAKVYNRPKEKLFRKPPQPMVEGAAGSGKGPSMDAILNSNQSGASTVPSEMMV